jgi:NAD(P)-dependent dehydrogenase (short-subunit alcohol dehydrogenase family)
VALKLLSGATFWPTEVAAVVAFLAPTMRAYVSGASYPVDGRRTAASCRRFALLPTNKSPNLK